MERMYSLTIQSEKTDAFQNFVPQNQESFEFVYRFYKKIKFFFSFSK